jgi:hypothetical protein
MDVLRRRAGMFSFFIATAMFVPLLGSLCKRERGVKMRVFKLAAIIGIATIGVLGPQGAAGAQSGYPGPTTTTTTTPAEVTVQANGTTTTATVTVGPGGSEVVTANVCGYAPASSVTVTVDGTVVYVSTADSSGCLFLTITISDPSISINGSPAVTIPYGTAAIAASGVSPSGAAVTDTVDVPVASPTAVVTSAPPTSSSSSGLAFTGADIMAMVVAGLALIALGFLVLTFSRRRRTIPT